MNNDSISPIFQFKYQLSDLFDTFRWIPQSDQTAALLAVEDFLIKLKQFCSYQETNSNDGSQNPSATFETEKSSEKIFTSLIPLHTFDMLNSQQLPSTTLIEQTINHNASPALSLNAFKLDSQNDLGIIQQTECTPVSASSTSSLSSSCEPNASFSELENTTLNTVMASLPCNTNLNVVVNDRESIVQAVPNDGSKEVCESARSEPPFLQLVPYADLVHNIPAAQFEMSTKEAECAAEALPCNGRVTLNPLQNSLTDRPSLENRLVFLDIHDARGQKNYGDIPVEGSYCDKNCKKSVLPPVTSFSRVTRSMARSYSKSQKIVATTEPQKKLRIKRRPLPKVGAVNVKNPRDSLALQSDSEITECINMEGVQDSIDENKSNVEVGLSVNQLPLSADGSTTAVKFVRDYLETGFPSQTSLLPHNLVVSLGPVSCRHCQNEFESVAELDKHVCKLERKFWMCKQCNLNFSQLQLFQKHLNSHKRNDCKICDARFTKRKALSKHSKLEHGVMEAERYYHCPHCERKFIKRPSLYTHLKEHAGSKIVCMKCGLMCDSEEIYCQHMLKHTEEAKFHCDKCNESFLRRQQYEQHMGCHNKYDCTLCDTNFSTKKQMIKHKRLVHGIRTREEKRHECKLCSKKFRRPTLLEIHMRVHTGEKPVQCSHCDKKFRTPKSLTRHLKTTTHMKACGQSEEQMSETEKSFLCAQCGAKFYRKQGLSRHMQQLHSEERPYECQFCDYKCKCKTNLKRHIELHKDERRFVCELCGASFHAHATLKEHHAYVHSDVRGFVCPNCGKGFKGRSGLRRHIRSHSDARPYVCYCGQSYKRMSHLKRHMSAIHSLSFKSKRVQRISAKNPSSIVLEDSNSSAAFPTPQPNVSNVCLDAMVPSEAMSLPVSSADGLLIIDDLKHSTAELAQAMTFEVTTQTAADEVIAHLQIPSDASPLVPQTLPSNQTIAPIGTQIPLAISGVSHAPDAVVRPLPSIAETAELRRAFDLSGVCIPLGHRNVALSIPNTCPPPSMLPSLPLLQPESMYNVIQSETPTSLSSSTNSEIQNLECQQNLQALPPEFYTQSLAQFLSM